mmetsp:Transcript_8484/g.11181  ORF Transcript_8484/g.11181 Transcript_8484/m.11181 type:complete len:263 (-) Transcript_8484:174-962(-)|eukprot:CAMPEP_0198136698 /NCGR_PEP_ID=MMETSP1443-20131203/320_1 /TAXON_ID=186043 /ORGANISM="Entomoneis sp., Strain CCMP2396" /LENGTH=262 /DNA_ID=CAMNT_0043797957 /DNA_START=146 /DNA_END=934 /DNA_ORIENTATION=+
MKSLISSSSFWLFLTFYHNAIVSVSSETVTWTGCGNFGDTAAELTVGKGSALCLQVGNSLNWVDGANYLRLSFTPEVDQYSRFHVQNSYTDLIRSTANAPFSQRNLTVSVSSQTKISFLRQYYDVVNDLVYPHLTAIVDVSSGNVRGVTWDDGCMFCSSNECTPVIYNYEGELQSKGQAGQPVGGCPLTSAECAVDPTLCDLTLYVVWTGTDSDSLTMQSSASRFSMFPKQDLGDRWADSLPEAPSVPGFGNNDENNNGRDM